MPLRGLQLVSQSVGRSVRDVRSQRLQRCAGYYHCLLSLNFVAGFAAVHMHPVLKASDHPLCRELIKQLEDCHYHHKVLKFFGKCNACKRELDQCLAKELLVKRELNYLASEARRPRSPASSQSN